MGRKIQADVVVTYPNEEGEWSTLELSKFEADYLRRALALAMGESTGITFPRNGLEDPAAYAK